ncbi:MAG TPA: SagB/ThcOx family dehydrogenase [Vicinamibacterales bacterium]|nr:SagB/ThcOx family dehydrogenase [Vicinamibacterales bacterium]
MLDLFGGWRSPADLVRLLPNYSPASLAHGAAALVRHGLLEAQVGGQPNEPDDELWDSWDPAAGLLHFSTKDLRYVGADQAADHLRARAAVTAMPSLTKRYRGARRVALPAPRLDGEFPRTLLERRTWRRFSSRPMSLDKLSTLLGLSSAVEYWLPVKGIGRMPFTSYPSGGAQHPLEVYVLARRVAGLAPGLYHYAADAHRLELIRKGASARQIVRYLPTQRWYGSASALFLITAVFSRTQWKYRFARGYRAVLAEAGHLCQNVCLTATWLGLAPFCTMALADSAIERDLRVDGVTESVVYAAGVGTRPRGASWAPWPAPHRVRRIPGPLGRM